MKKVKVIVHAEIELDMTKKEIIGLKLCEEFPKVDGAIDTIILALEKTKEEVSYLSGGEVVIESGLNFEKGIVSFDLDSPYHKSRKYKIFKAK